MTTGYTVIDVETTGLSPETHDRIVEIGVVYVSASGQVQDQWSTLLNPGRDVGPTKIHGITATHVHGAPSFQDIAPYLLRAVAGRTIVAHNITFDLRFIAAELLRAGIPLDRLPLSGLCTMQWASAYLASTSRRLTDCCRAGGVTLSDAHSAAADALATAQLLRHFLDRSSGTPPWADTLTETQAYPWPPFEGAYPELRLVRRTDVHQRRGDEWLDRVVSRMPRAADARVDAYLAVLERAMLDGFLAESEKDELVAVAISCGLTRGQVLDLHADYLRALASIVLADGVVTTAERAALDQAAGLLGLRSTDVDAALEGEREVGAAAANLTASGLTLKPGDRVVFTGDMSRDRSDWEALAHRIGLRTGGVAKSTRLVVAADPNSLSGKAAKARSYGIPIVTEAAFSAMVASQFGVS